MSRVVPHMPHSFSDQRVAIVHDWLTVYGGAERVLEQIIDIVPHADLFSLIDFVPQDQRAFLRHKRVQTSFIQRLPVAHRAYRRYLPLMPLAIEQFDFSRYDLVISSTYAIAKGIITGPDQLHVSYVHSPARYAWDLQHEYFMQAGLTRGVKAWLAKWMMHRVRMWDIRTSNGVDHFVANSNFIRRRIWKVYRRSATVIYPPVDINRFKPCERKSDYFLTVSRMVPYKRIDLIVAAFQRMPDKRLVVIGEGPELGRVRAMASSNVSVLGYQADEEVRHYMQRARAFVFAAQEDFGIVPVEAQACGTAVIAYAKGGVTESVRGLDTDHPTGVFFREPTVESLINAIELFERNRGCISPLACRENAVRFAPDRFRRELERFLHRQLTAAAETRPAASHSASLDELAVSSAAE